VRLIIASTHLVFSISLCIDLKNNKTQNKPAAIQFTNYIQKRFQATWKRWLEITCIVVYLTKHHAENVRVCCWSKNSSNWNVGGWHPHWMLLWSALASQRWHLVTTRPQTSSLYSLRKHLSAVSKVRIVNSSKLALIGAWWVCFTFVDILRGLAV